MEAANFLHTTSLIPEYPFYTKSPRRKMGFNGRKRQVSTFVVAASSKRDAYGQDFDGKLVDENMIVLRKRIGEMKMVEKKDEPPHNWMEWEKIYYRNYDSDIYEAMGLLQSQLMNTRPSLALGMVLLITLSVPFSTGVIVFHLLDLAKGILAGSGIHL